MKLETKGIGTTWWIEIYDDDVNEDITQKIEDYILSFESLYSRFKRESYIGRLNNDKQLTDFPNELLEMLKYCQSISELTDFRFNVCSGSLQVSHGYDKDYSFNEKSKPELKLLRNGIKKLTKDKIEILDDVTVDLGGIGKGWVIDTIKLILTKNGYNYYSINGGGDIYATSDKGKPVTFYMENPFNLKEYIGSVDLKDSAFACSSPSRRVWSTVQKNEYHHLINANTGDSIYDKSAVFTYGKTGLSVDTASTCIFISPMEEASKIAQELEVEYSIITPDQKMIKSEGFIGNFN